MPKSTADCLDPATDPSLCVHTIRSEFTGRDFVTGGQNNPTHASACMVQGDPAACANVSRIEQDGGYYRCAIYIYPCDFVPCLSSARSIVSLLLDHQTALVRVVCRFPLEKPLHPCLCRTAMSMPCVDARRDACRLMYAAFHCHAPACISGELWNRDTGELICRNTAVYGTGYTPVNETGYVVAIPVSSSVFALGLRGVLDSMISCR